MAGLDDFENEEDAGDAASARAYLERQANSAPPAAPLPDTQPPPFVPGAPPPPAPVPLGAAVPEAFAATPPPGPPSAPPAGMDGTTTQPSVAETPPSPAPSAPNLSDLGPPPERPKLTGDPTKDNQANLEFGQKLGDYQVALAKKQGEFQAHADSIAKERATREADEERRVVDERQRQQQEFQARQQARQQQIDDAVKEKQAAYSDLKNPEGQSFGDKLGAAIAIALGGYGQGLMLKGGIKGAQNEGLIAVNQKIEQEHQRKVERLKAASDSVLEARYGFKDAADNQRAAMNDLDADRAAKYRLIAAEAQQQLQEQGVLPAEAKTNAVVLNALQEAQKSTDQITAREEQRENERAKAEAENKLAQAHLVLGERQLKATEASRRDTAYEHKREFELKEQDAKDRAAAKKEADAEKATVGSVRQNAVLGNLAEAEKAAKDIKPGTVTMDSVKQLQTNTEASKGAEHSATSGVIGNLTTRFGRAVGVVPRGRFDGIPEEQQKQITATEQVITHLTEMQQGKNIETLEQYNERYNPYVPGLSEDEVRRREKALAPLVAEQRAIQDPNGVGTKRQEKAKPPEAPKGDAAEAREFLEKAAPKKQTSSRPPAMTLNGKTYRLQPDGTYQ